MPRELLSLADELAALYEAFPERGSVTFKPVEPNLTLFFEVGTTGTIHGTCSLRDDLVSGDVLQGHFTVEQSELPGLVHQIREFVRTVAPSP